MSRDDYLRRSLEDAVAEISSGRPMPPLQSIVDAQVRNRRYAIVGALAAVAAVVVIGVAGARTLDVETFPTDRPVELTAPEGDSTIPLWSIATTFNIGVPEGGGFTPDMRARILTRITTEHGDLLLIEAVDPKGNRCQGIAWARPATVAPDERAQWGSAGGRCETPEDIATRDPYERALYVHAVPHVAWPGQPASVPSGLVHVLWGVAPPGSDRLVIRGTRGAELVLPARPYFLTTGWEYERPGTARAYDSAGLELGSSPLPWGGT